MSWEANAHLAHFRAGRAVAEQPSERVFVLRAHRVHPLRDKRERLVAPGRGRLRGTPREHASVLAGGHIERVRRAALGRRVARRERVRMHSQRQRALRIGAPERKVPE
jgi:hypothetical protein